MTYQELLVEFDRRRSSVLQDRVVDANTQMILNQKIADIQWAIQSILEKLRDENVEK